ncbi:unnamed protein product (macronuclear) [Paramecium tetraurelia]|uniref:Cyclic nucleotide-binding domain-containing protein n=1 Tax=Paramecium tetraurelia TaxID=5888 RepID=A0BMT0_PARTE|nr:uncharacterized protein GSPATT00030483001 [Paramecium tetraurelia]CAK59847.1 unnamed protein product [Paramecium tetraurelia]|eukprot:XP_001427245.1 hypothetical protein (macronuclear) [Paramecium tetraurelia strain d4-2]
MKSSTTLKGVTNTFQQIVLSAKQKEENERRHMSILEKAATLWQRDSSHTKTIQLQRTIYILKQYSQNRTDEQLEAVKTYFEENFPYYSKFKEKLDHESCKSLFREMTLEWYDSTKIIFRHGDPGRRMYFVLQGELVILIPKTKNTSENPPQKKQKFKYNSFYSSSFEEWVKYVFVDYAQVATKIEGDQFGEIAIEQKVTRTATVAAKTEVILAVITYDLYQRILGAFQHELTNQKIAFISKIPIFSVWQRQNQLVLLQSLEVQNKKVGQFVFQKGKPDEYIYLVINGEIEVVQWSTPNGDQVSNHHNFVPKPTIMAIINSGQFFGDYEHFKQLNYRITTAKAKTDSTYYRIKYRQLLDYFQLYSSIDDFLKYENVKFQIQSHLGQRTNQNPDLTERTGDDTYQFDLDQIKSSYYKKIKVEQQIDKLRKKMEKTVEQAQKAIYYHEIENLKQSIENIESIQADKYSFLVPFRSDPYVNEMNLIRSETRNQRNRLQQQSESDLRSKDLQFSLRSSIKTQGQTRSQSQSNLNSLSYAKIMQSKLKKLSINVQPTIEINKPQFTQSKTTKPEHHPTNVENIHNVKMDFTPISNSQLFTKKKHQGSVYKFQIKSSY